MPSKDACLKTDGSFVTGPPVAILAADVVGFVRLMETDERDALSRLRRLCDRELFPLTSDNGGRVVKTTGDGFLAVFETAEIAMRCAIILQRKVHSLQNGTPAERKILFRMAVHVSHVIEDGNDIFGDGVNVASRLQSFAETGGVAVSEIVTESITDLADLSAIDLGETYLHNRAQPVRIFSYRIRGLGNADIPAAKNGQAAPLDRRPAISIRGRR